MTTPPHPRDFRNPFTDADTAALVDLFTGPAQDNEPQRPPWTWSALTSDERLALGRAIDDWTTTFNHVFATAPAHLIPPCWRLHPGLATELAVHIWLWYQAHRADNASITHAAEYYLRHLPGFRSRITEALGETAAECRRLEHPRNWRAETSKLLGVYTTRELDHHNQPAADATDLLGALHYGFMPPTGSDHA